MLVNRAFVHAYFNDGNPVGQTVFGTGHTIRIVGVVGDVPIANLGDTIPPTVYVPHAQDPSTFLRVVIRTPLPQGEVIRDLRSIVERLEPGAAIVQPTTMNDFIASSTSVFMRRFPLLLVGAFAATALALAIIGVYGVVSYAVAQRSRELAIRVALGAEPRRVVALVLRHGGVIVASGIVIGVASALLLTKLVSGMLYGVTTSDPATYAGVSALLAVVAVASTIIPARRASRVDPAEVLRAD
jgi:predicted lysophospholipase L1 biosynthesis ABC-type transport system permease subunit